MTDSLVERVESDREEEEGEGIVTARGIVDPPKVSCDVADPQLLLTVRSFLFPFSLTFFSFSLLPPPLSLLARWALGDGNLHLYHSMHDTCIFGMYIPT